MKPPHRVLLLALVAVAFQAVMVTANVWPAARSAPRYVPLVVAGSDPAAQYVAQQVEAQSPGAFEVKRLSDEQAARQALSDRDAYGAIVVAPTGPHMLIASGAGPVIAQMLTQMSQRLSMQPVEAPEDVAPASRDDPRGAGGSALVLALILSGIAGAVLMGFLVRSKLWRTIGLVVFAACGGVTSAGIIQTGLSVLPGSFLAVAGTIALVTLAVSASVAGLGAAIPRAGFGLGAAVMMLLANPWSGATSAPEMLPRPWGAVGQDMPAGAAVSLLRSVAFFDGAGAGTPLTVLLLWTSYGLILLAAGTRGHRPPSVPAPVTMTSEHGGHGAHSREAPSMFVIAPYGSPQ